MVLEAPERVGGLRRTATPGPVSPGVASTYSVIAAPRSATGRSSRSFAEMVPAIRADRPARRRWTPGIPPPGSVAWLLSLLAIGAAVGVGTVAATAQAVPADCTDDTWARTDATGPSLSTARTDGDSDGLTDRCERALGTNPSDPDTDGDRLADGREVSDHGTNPRAADSDGDGLVDSREIWLGTDPTSADTDGDGLADGRERAIGTSPRLVDSDADGRSDAEEATAGASRDTANAYGASIADGDQKGILPSTEATREPESYVGLLASVSVLAGGAWLLWRRYRRWTSPVVVKTT